MDEGDTLAPGGGDKPLNCSHKLLYFQQAKEEYNSITLPHHIKYFYPCIYLLVDYNITDMGKHESNELFWQNILIPPPWKRLVGKYVKYQNILFSVNILFLYH